jgi:LacI family transcriptional regulator
MADGSEARRATIRDVAQAAGVSPRTVTRVSLGQPHVGAEARRRVEAAIRLLDYRPDAQARGLALGCSNLVGMICENPNPNYLIDVQLGLLDGLLPQGLELVVRPGEQASPDFLGDVRSFVERLKLAGMVLTPPLSHDTRVIALLRELNCPYVCISARALEAPDRMVAGGDRNGAREVGRRLIALGHRCVGAVMGPSNFISSEERQAGLEEGLAEGGVTLAPGYRVRAAYTFDSGVEAGQTLLALDPRPTAIFAANDEMAAGVLRAAHRASLVIPADLSVIGFDDLGLASAQWPPLTSVRIPTRHLGCLAGWKLSKAAGRWPAWPAPREVESPQLVVRESCGPAPAA